MDIDRDRYNPDAIRAAFRFLVDEFGYSVARDEEPANNGRPYGFVIEYTGHDRRIHLYHDYKEMAFHFVIIRGVNTRFPNDDDNENLRVFWKFFQIFEPQLSFKETQPVDQTCDKAARLNAQLLRKYASKILLGEEWV